MPARAGNWELLNEASDPIVADVTLMQDLVHYYTSTARLITYEADLLRRIGDGDDSQFKGESADAVRSRSKDVASALDSISARYDAVKDALTGYLPELERALAESAGALRDAEDASSLGLRAQNLPDPTLNRTSDAPALTAHEQSEADAKKKAVANAQAGADAAVARLRNAVDGLNVAGRAAAATIRAAWNDGLHDTTGDKIKAFFTQLLKIIVKIFTYIGIALALLAIIIPGVGMLAFMGAVAAAVSFVANITLAGMGEGSWLDVITSAVGIVLLGIGAAISKAVSVARTVAMSKAIPAVERTITIKGLDKIAQIKNERQISIASWRNAANPAEKDELYGTIAAKTQQMKDMKASLQDAVRQPSMTRIIDGYQEKPLWWNLGKELRGWDAGKVKDVFKGDWRWDRLLTVDAPRDVAKMRLDFWKDYGVDVATVPKWYSWVAGGRIVAGWTNTFVYGQGIKPSGYGSDQSRIPGYNEVHDGMTHGF